MKVYRNLAEIKRKEQMGRRITLGGLAVLFVGLLASFTPNWFPPGQPAANPLVGFIQNYWAFISFGALALGFVASNIGSFYINRFAPRRWPDSNRVARPDELLEAGLKGFDDKYSLFVWSLPPSPYVLVGPSGVQVLILRGDKGQVRVEGDRWRESFSLTRLFTAFTREGLGNPSRDLEQAKQELRELLQKGKAAGELSVDPDAVPLEGAVVFVNPAVTLEVENPTVPALRVNQIKKYLRGKKVRLLSGPDLRNLTEFLRNVSTFSE